MEISPSDSSFIKNFKKELNKTMKFYFKKYNLIENDELITATVIDPQYKKLSFIEETSKKKSFYKIAAETIKAQNYETESNESCVDDFLYFSDPDEDEANFTTPLKEINSFVLYPKDTVEKLYKANKKKFTRLSQAVEKFLLAPATSVPSERLFSHASFQVN